LGCSVTAFSHCAIFALKEIVVRVFARNRRFGTDVLPGCGSLIADAFCETLDHSFAKPHRQSGRGIGFDKRVQHFMPQRLAQNSAGVQYIRWLYIDFPSGGLRRHPAWFTGGVTEEVQVWVDPNDDLVIGHPVQPGFPVTQQIFR
jgi:hypothetical protein